MIVDYEKYWCCIGADPAKEQDLYAGSMRILPKQPNYGAYRIPILGDLFRLNGMNYTMLVEEFESGMLRKYAQFASLDMDYTNEKHLVDTLITKYGEDRVFKTVFTRGEGGTKLNLMKIARDFYKSPGHKWPDPEQIKDSRRKELVSDLMQQVVREDFSIGAGGAISFKHTGKHNDLLHADSLALQGCQRIINSMATHGELGHVGGTSSGRMKIVAHENKRPDVEAVLRGEYY